MSSVCWADIPELSVRDRTDLDAAAGSGTIDRRGRPHRVALAAGPGEANRSAATRERGARRTPGPGLPKAEAPGVRLARGAAAAASVHYARLRSWTFGRRQRGTVRGTTRRIIPAQQVPSVRLPVSSVQLARVQPVSTLLVNGRSAVRIRSPAPRSASDFRTVVRQHDDPVHNGMMVAACIGPPSTWVAREAMKMKTNSPDAMSGRP